MGQTFGIHIGSFPCAGVGDGPPPDRAPPGSGFPPPPPVPSGAHPGGGGRGSGRPPVLVAVLVGVLVLVAAVVAAVIVTGDDDDDDPSGGASTTTPSTITAPGRDDADTGAGDQRIASLWASAVVQDDGSARIDEVIHWDFAGNARHGIYRDIPGLGPDAEVTAESATAPDDVLVTATEIDGVRGIRVRIGDPALTVSGLHRYELHFTLPALAVGDTLDWEVVGTGWDVPVGPVEAHLVAPFALEGPRCLQGAAGSDGPCDVSDPEPGHVVATLDGLDTRQGVSLEAGAGDAVATPAAPDPPS